MVPWYHNQGGGAKVRFPLGTSPRREPLNLSVKGVAFDLFHCKEGVAFDLSLEGVPFHFLDLKEGVAFDLPFIRNVSLLIFHWKKGVAFDLLTL